MNCLLWCGFIESIHCYYKRIEADNILAGSCIGLIKQNSNSCSVKRIVYYGVVVLDRYIAIIKAHKTATFGRIMYWFNKIE